MPLILDGDLHNEGGHICCPYCEARTMETADMPERDDTFAVDCDACGRAFLVERIVSVEFVSRPLPEPAGQLALFGAEEVPRR